MQPGPGTLHWATDEPFPRCIVKWITTVEEFCLRFIAGAGPVRRAAGRAGRAPQLASQIVDQYAEHIFYNSGATGMALVVIDGNQVVNRSFGDTKPGNNLRPRPDSLIRIASITKLMTSEVMVKMAAEGQVKLTDPLRKYAPKGAYVPAYNAGQPITLLNLATHTSALPREQPGKKPPKTPVFTWPTKAQRWQWLAHANITTPPGVHAAYSNLAYDLLADALSRAAGKPYNALLKENHRTARHGRHHADAEP